MFTAVSIAATPPPQKVAVVGVSETTTTTTTTIIMALYRVAALGLLLAVELAGAAKTASPNDAISKPSCSSSKSVSVRYSSGSERLYLESSSGGGCITLKEVWESLGGKAPLYAVDSSTGDVSKSATGTWLLTESLYVEDGVTLQVSARAV